MRKVSTDSIDQAGCVIAADVVGRSGNVLLTKGDSVTPALGRRLRNWGIEYVYVVGEAGAERHVKIKAKSPIDIKSELYDIFLGTLNSARMMMIFDAVYKHKLHRLEVEGDA